MDKTSLSETMDTGIGGNVLGRPGNMEAEWQVLRKNKSTSWLFRPADAYFSLPFWM